MVLEMVSPDSDVLDEASLGFAEHLAKGIIRLAVWTD
jgi:hypothetical protein